MSVGVCTRLDPVIDPARNRPQLHGRVLVRCDLQSPPPNRFSVGSVEQLNEREIVQRTPRQSQEQRSRLGRLYLIKS